MKRLRSAAKIEYASDFSKLEQPTTPPPAAAQPVAPAPPGEKGGESVLDKGLQKLK